MDNFVFTIDHNKKENIVSQNYCLIGSEDFLDMNGHPVTSTDNENTLAKTIQRNNDPMQYFIRLSNNNKLYNPLSPIGDDRHTSVIDNACRPTNRFVAVNSMVFNYYLQFLSSKNILWLNKAEREMI